MSKSEIAVGVLKGASREGKKRKMNECEWSVIQKLT